MALYGGKRDARLIASFNAEILNAIVDTEIEFFKLHAAVSAVEIIVTGSLFLASCAFSKKLVDHIQQYSHLNLLKG